MMCTMRQDIACLLGEAGDEFAVIVPRGGNDCESENVGTVGEAGGVVNGCAVLPSELRIRKAKGKKRHPRARPSKIEFEQTSTTQLSVHPIRDRQSTIALTRS